VNHRVRPTVSGAVYRVPITWYQATPRALVRDRSQPRTRFQSPANEGVPYQELGRDHLARRDPERETKRLIAQLELLGHRVMLEDAVAA
jgi:hypothetical protein